MAERQEKGVMCPHCGRVQRIGQWKSVNWAEDTPAKKRLLKGTLFTPACECCGEPIQLSYPCLVHDPEHLAMVLFWPGEQRDEQTLSAKPPQPGYRLRVVDTPQSLREKLLIFNAGLEDTVIELVKVFYYFEFKKQHPQYSVSEVLFNDAPEGGQIEFYEEKSLLAAVALSKAFYQKVQVRYAERIWQCIRQEMMAIDPSWAAKVLEL